MCKPRSLPIGAYNKVMPPNYCCTRMLAVCRGHSWYRSCVTRARPLHFSRPYPLCEQGKRGKSKCSGLLNLDGYEEP